MPKKLRLFSIWLVRTHETVKSKGKQIYYDSKNRAKFERDKLQEETGEQYAVILGPDHKRYARVAL